MANDLLCPMQMRVNDVELCECPKSMEDRPSNTSHSLKVTQDGEDLWIPFGIRGVTSHFPTRKPTQNELATCRRFDLTWEEPEWDPMSTTCQDQENSTVDGRGMVNDTGDLNKRFTSSVKVALSRDQACEFVNRSSQCSSVLTKINPNLRNNCLLQSLHRSVKVLATQTGKRKGNLTAERLATNWSIPLDTAKQTLKATTQGGVRTAANPSLPGRFQTNDRQLRCRRLRCNMRADAPDATMVTSKRGNKHTQIFPTDSDGIVPSHSRRNQRGTRQSQHCSQEMKSRTSW